MSETTKATDVQVGGGHYKDLPIQPVEYCQKNKLGFCESCVVEYVSRHQDKNGKQDIEKAIQFLNLLLEIEYPEREIDSGTITMPKVDTTILKD